ncbi:exosortase/archaeosortase family protein [Roseiconus lacunae]|uniref:exosortase/archaeosortase family protein n=1 Tax=Roseiconus lacunae TaxID=2605694 RepID=UPI001E2EB26A|nr:exosortase/archaeosortase family protein [Roseiconus lacunae]MCD0459869.1 exosortase/archaeosortase family protein [Roseiconus lacunae]
MTNTPSSVATTQPSGKPTMGDRSSDQSPPSATSNPLAARWLIATAIICIAVLLTYWSVLLQLAGRWWGNQDYIHGFFVVPFAIYLAWSRRALFANQELRGQFWIGLPLIVLSVVMRGFSAYMSDPVLSPLSLPICLAGIVLIIGGIPMLKWLWPSLIILPFMIPLPDFMASWGNLALQRTATITSTFILQTLGIPAASFGNVIVLTNTELGVEEACSGLRSTVLFLAVSVSAALMLDDKLEGALAVMMAIPAAVLANIIRIVATGILYQYADSSLAEAVFHDFFGFLMLPLAAGMVWGVITLFRQLLPAEHDEYVPIGTIKSTTA